MEKKITYIVSNINKAVSFEWVAENLDRRKYTISFLLIGAKPGYLYEWLKNNNIEVNFITYKSKNQLFWIFLKVFYFLFKSKPSVVHTHLFEANLVGLFAAKFLGIKKRIYTRHHSTFHHEYFPQAIKWDRIINWLATDIVAISENVRNVLLKYEDVDYRKIHLIHHGFDLSEFQSVTQERVELLTSKYGIEKTKGPVIGVISRYTLWKGIQYIIPAFQRILDNYPDALLIIANANGPDKSFIQELLYKNIPSSNVLEIEFENDLFALYKLFDIYVHTPINSEIEAFGQTYVESLASGVPSIFTLSGVAAEFIRNEYNALVVEFEDANQIYNALLKLLNDRILCQSLIQRGTNSIQKFSLNNYIDKLDRLYE